MINDIFKIFGEQAADILFEIITECMDDYLYIFDLQNNTFEISQSAVERYIKQFTEAMGSVMIGRGAFHSASKVKRELCWSVWKSKCRYK